MALYRRERSPYWWMDVMVGYPPRRERQSTKRPHLMGDLPFDAKPRTKAQREAYREAKAVEAAFIKSHLDRTQLGRLEEITIREALERCLKAGRRLKDLTNVIIRAEKIVGLTVDPKRLTFTDQPKFECRFHLRPDMMLHELRTKHIEDLRLAREDEGEKDGTINLQVALIRRACSLAQSAGVRVPSGVTFRRVPVAGKMRYATPEEEERLLFELDPKRERKGTGKYGTRPPMMQRQLDDQYDLVVFLLDTGARYREVAEISWAAVDTIEWKTINIYRSKVGNEGILMMTDRLREVLQRRYAEMTSPYVFPGYKSGKRPRGYAVKGIARAIERAGLNEPHLVQRFGKFTVHSLRDTFATKCLRGGLSLYKVSKLLGHTDTRQTQKYAHLELHDVATEAADVLNRMSGEAGAVSAAA